MKTKREIKEVKQRNENIKKQKGEWKEREEGVKEDRVQRWERRKLGEIKE